MLLWQKYEVLNEVQNLDAKLIRLSLFSVKYCLSMVNIYSRGPFCIKY